MGDIAILKICPCTRRGPVNRTKLYAVLVDDLKLQSDPLVVYRNEHTAPGLQIQKDALLVRNPAIELRCGYGDFNGKLVP